MGIEYKSGDSDNNEGRDDENDEGAGGAANKDAAGKIDGAETKNATGNEDNAEDCAVPTSQPKKKQRTTLLPKEKVPPQCHFL